MDDGNFDVIIIGTGLAESIAAGALSKIGFKVAHIDENQYYGGNEASLTLDELAQWIDGLSSSSKYTSASRSAQIPSQARHYSISLSPSIIPSIGPVISSLVSSGVAKYGRFRLLERVGVYNSGAIKNVPGSKEDVFKNKEISLIDKRRLMRFLMFAGGDFENEKEFKAADQMVFSEFLSNAFSLKNELQSALVFALGFCLSATEPTVPTLHRIRKYLRSVGRYGPLPFLVGQYGGTGEIAQGFCRAAAVCGGVYILGRRITSITHPLANSTDEPTSSESKTSSHRFSVTMDDIPDTLTCPVIISSPSHLPSNLSHLAKYLPPDNSTPSFSVARGIAIVDRGLVFPPTTTTVSPVEDEDASADADSSDPAPQPTPPAPLDAGVIVFPPSSVPGGSSNFAATVLITGEGTMSAPRGKWIWYITLPLSTPLPESSAEDILRPYLDATLALTSDPTTMTSSQPTTSDSSIPAAPSDTISTPPQPQPQPLFTSFYIEHPTTPTPPQPLDSESQHQQHQPFIVPSTLSPVYPLPDQPDAAATSAEAIFWETVNLLKQAGVKPTRRRGLGGDEVLGEGEEVEGEVETEIDTFWPPIEVEGDESGAED